jgi:hypothetical protein
MTRQSALAIGLILGGVTCSLAETPEQRQACTDSAFQVCQQFIPDREQVFACLIRNKDVIAPLCREALAAFLPPDPPPPKQAAKPKIATKTATKTKPTTKTNSKKVAAPLSLNPKVP